MKITQIIPVSQPMYALFNQDHGLEANPVVCLALEEWTDDDGEEYQDVVPYILLDDVAADPKFASNFKGYCFEHELEDYDIFLGRGE
jgi:hypothetical protein